MNQATLSRRGLFARLAAAGAALLGYRTPRWNRASHAKVDRRADDDLLAIYEYDELGRVLSIVHDRTGP